jgi:hypothetical protein
MSEHSEPVTLEFLGRMIGRLSDDVADLKSQFIVQVAILQRLEASIGALDARVSSLDTGQRTIATELRQVHSRLDRVERRLRSVEERLDPAPV